MIISVVMVSTLTAVIGNAIEESEAAAEANTTMPAPTYSAPAQGAPAAPAVPKSDDKAQALSSAQFFSDDMHMSKAAIYDQLGSEYGKYTPETAQYAVDNITADYKTNALEYAKILQEELSLPTEELREQLASTSQYGAKFTTEEADYAIENLK